MWEYNVKKNLSAAGGEVFLLKDGVSLFFKTYTLYLTTPKPVNLE